MKVITVHFEDAEFEEITRVKKSEAQSWRDFILQLARERLAYESATVTIKGDLVVTGDIVNNDDGDDQ